MASSSSTAAETPSSSDSSVPQAQPQQQQPASTRPVNASAMASDPAHPKKPINLLRGWPSASLPPTAALSAASQRLLGNPSLATPALLYGPDPGFEPLRGALAAWLAEFYGTPSDVERVAVSGGASQSVACILQSFTDPAYTRAVWMVAPCYFLACPIFADAGFGDRMHAVPEDEEGIELAVLEAGLRKFAEEDGGGKGGGENKCFKDPGPHRKLYRHVIYCVPSFSNPSGKTMSLRRREGLLELARRYDALIICDDVYDMLQWQPTTTTSSSSSGEGADLNKALLPRLTDLERTLGPSPHDPPGKTFGHAVSNGSFSKLAGPGLRTGWTESAPDLAYGLSQTGSTRSGGAPSQFAAAVVYELLVSGGLAAHIRDALRPAYRRRHGLVVEMAREVLGPLDDVFGGYFVWFRLPGGLKADEVAKRCQAEENLAIGTGGLFAVQGDAGGPRFENEVRLCFAWEDEADLEDGVTRLGKVVWRMLHGKPMEVAAGGAGRGLDELK
ncbi:aminotransferase class I and II domain-containing protein [Apiospora hydei]|uniref:Aminotransferase class I and II domain-containing protein n=1 Tax=Apiospora hydei TaxID=1337664 RepID=A0ABR1WBZ7_9PEZI